MRRGEKVVVEVNVVIEGEAGPDTMVSREADAIEIEAEALSIPEQLTVSIEGAEPGTQFTAGQITLPAGVNLISDPDMLVVNVVNAPTAEDLEEEGAGEAAEAPEGEAAAEKEAGEAGEAQPRTSPSSEDVADPLLVVGLGNPGDNYARTRHNIGFMVADLLAARLGSKFKAHKNSGAEVVTGRLAGHAVVVAKPRCYMNESGRQVGPLAKFYSVDPGDVIAIHDDLDLEFGRIRLKLGGGEGGHNGLRSLASALGYQGLSAGAHRDRPAARTQRPRGVRAGELRRRRTRRSPHHLRASRRRHRVAHPSRTRARSERRPRLVGVAGRSRVSPRRTG